MTFELEYILEQILVCTGDFAAYICVAQLYVILGEIHRVKCSQRVIFVPLIQLCMENLIRFMDW